MISSSFRTLQLHAKTLAAVDAAGYSNPTEVQQLTIPELLAGRDVVATAQTGTGKTAAFVLPMLQRVEPARRAGRTASPSALILTPTRELAAQITESISVYGQGSQLRSAAIFGGASRNRQISELRTHPDILVATPGRLLDLIAERYITLDCVSYLVLDEADRMLDMGFIPVVRQIVGMTPNARQTSLFSATMPAPIQSLANDFLRNPVRIEAESGELRVEKIEHSVMHVDQSDKLALLPQLIRDKQMFRVLVFTRTKHRASKVARLLARENLPSDAIHGNKSQAARTRALDAFKSGKIQVLVATDVASRGIDVDDITHVINFELPNEAETYVHRIGRTARAGADGQAISLCDSSEVSYLRDIERLIGIRLSIDRAHPYHQERAERSSHSSGSAPWTRGPAATQPNRRRTYGPRRYTARDGSQSRQPQSRKRR